MQDRLPSWLARPAGVLSTLVAALGSFFIFWAAATGGYWWAVWGVVCFVGAGLLWHLADYAALARGSEAGPDTA